MAPRSFGVVYVAVGADYTAEAIGSAESLRKVDPTIPISLFTDANRAFEQGLFDDVFIIESPFGDSNDKINGMQRSPFAKTLFLDTDTRVLRSIADLQVLLENFDMAVAFDPIRVDRVQEHIPESFPTHNTGVMAYCRCEAVNQLLADWKHAFCTQEPEPGKTPRDQPPFRSVLYQSSLRFTVLPCEYNLRVIYPYMIGGNAYVKILHGRHETLDSAIEPAGSLHFYPRVFGRNYSVAELIGMTGRRILDRLLIRTGLAAQRRAKRVGVKGKL